MAGLLREIAPALQRVGVLTDPEFPAFRSHMVEIEAVALSLGVAAIPVSGRDGAEIEQAIKSLAQQPNSGLVVLPTPASSVEREKIIALTSQLRLLAIHAHSGALIAYDFDVVSLFDRAGHYVARILSGEKPGDLPVQAPTKYELVVNLKTAKEIGLRVPESILARADEAIE